MEGSISFRNLAEVIEIDSSQSQQLQQFQNYQNNSSCNNCKVKGYIYRKDKGFRVIYEKWMLEHKLRDYNKRAYPRALTQCLHCQKILTSNQMKRHSKIHHRTSGSYSQLKINGQYKCLICYQSKIFLSRLELKLHLASHSLEDIQGKGYSELVAKSLSSLDWKKQKNGNLKSQESSSLTSVSDLEEEKFQLDYNSDCDMDLTSSFPKLIAPETKNDDIIQRDSSQLLEVVSPSFRLDLKTIICVSQNLNLLKSASNQDIKGSSNQLVFEGKKLIANNFLCQKLWQNFKILVHLSELQSERVDQIIQVLLSDAKIALVMRKYSYSLDEALEEMALSQQDFKKIFLDIVKSLELIHNLGIVHRCLMPRKV